MKNLKWKWMKNIFFWFYRRSTCPPASNSEHYPKGPPGHDTTKWPLHAYKPWPEPRPLLPIQNPRFSIDLYTFLIKNKSEGSHTPWAHIKPPWRSYLGRQSTNFAALNRDERPDVCGKKGDRPKVDKHKISRAQAPTCDPWAEYPNIAENFFIHFSKVFFKKFKKHPKFYFHVHCDEFEDQIQFVFLHNYFFQRNNIWMLKFWKEIFIQN